MLSEYYQSQGKTLPSVQERAGLYSSLGLGTGYAGTAEQNNALEAKLRAGSAQTAQPTTVPTANGNPSGATPAPVAAPTSGGSYDLNSVVDAMMSKGYNNRAEAEAVAKGDLERYGREYLGGSATSSVAGGATPAASINLEQKYNELLGASGMSEVQKQADAKQAEIAKLEADAAEERAKIGENPFLSEAALNGRIAKIDKKLNEKTTVLQKELSTLLGTVQSKKDEVNNKLGLTVQQYNIDKASRQENLQNFNTLLASKALVNASAADIATLAAQTGLAPSFIQSAITESAIREPQITSYKDDNGNVTIVSIDKQTGDVLKTVSAGKIANAENGGGAASGAKTVKASFQADISTVAGKSIDGTWVGQFPQLVMKYAPYMSLEEIYTEYLASPLGKKYGTPSEDRADIKELYTQARGGE